MPRKIINQDGDTFSVSSIPEICFRLLFECGLLLLFFFLSQIKLNVPSGNEGLLTCIKMCCLSHCLREIMKMFGMILVKKLGLYFYQELVKDIMFGVFTDIRCHICNIYLYMVYIYIRNSLCLVNHISANYRLDIEMCL